jgi:hypothetical protein
MTDEREHSTLTIAGLVPVALIAMVVALSALKRCIYAAPQIAGLRQQDEPAPARPLLADDAHTRNPEDPDGSQGVRRRLENGQRLAHRDGPKPPAELTNDHATPEGSASVDIRAGLTTGDR